MNASIIAIDWGTTSARAYLLGASGEVLDERAAPLGIANLKDGRFEEALQTLLGEHASPGIPRLACGMIGSRQGWVEAPYIHCPASFDKLGEQLVTAGNGALKIVPGLITRDSQGMPDVLRGEESQIVGAVETKESIIAVLPGTHCKWVRVDQGTIVDFRTYMTGELYAVLLKHSILGRLADQSAELAEAAFDRGVQLGLAGRSVMHDLFGARTLGLTGALTPQDVPSWLSGLLIGREIRDAKDEFGMAQRIRLIGDDALCARYARACTLASMTVEQAPTAAAARGLWRIAAM